MDERRFAALTRTLERALSRRRTLGRGLLALTAGGLALNQREGAAKKGKNGKKGKCKANMPRPASCQQACGGTCNICISRTDSPALLCGSLIAIGTQTCVSDYDCLEAEQPYCASRYEQRQNGEVTELGEGEDGVCADAFVCGT